MNLLNLPRQYQTIKPEIDEAVQSVLSSGRFTGGSSVESFEREFASYVGVNYCVGVGSGTDALRIALEAAGIRGEVIVPVNTFFATAEAVVQAGATPVFCDCAEDLYTLSLSHLLSLVTPQTEAIIPVHLYGLPCQMDLVMKIAERHNLFVLEDCSHAHGAEYKGAPVGSFGHAAAFSFNPVKILGAAGDAGGIVTSQALLAAQCQKLRDHGRHKKHVHLGIGYNSRLDSLQAAILSVKLKHLDEWVVRRRGFATSYRVHLLVHYPEIMRPVEAINALHSYHQFVVRVSGRDRIQMSLSTVYDIETGIHYPMLLSRQPAFLHLGTRAEDTPTAAAYAKEILSLPINESMHEEEVRAVCDALIEVVNGLGGKIRKGLRGMGADEEYSESLWYVTTVIEFVLEVLNILFPDRRSKLSCLYRIYCRLKRSFPGDMSPALGVVDSETRSKLIRRYLASPEDGILLLEKELEGNADFETIGYGL